MDDRDLKHKKQVLQQMMQDDAEQGLEPDGDIFADTMLTYADEDGATIVSHPSLLNNELKDLNLTEDRFNDPKKTGHTVKQPQALTHRPVLSTPPSEYQGPGIPEDAYYPEEQPRLIDLKHDTAYTPSQLKAAEILKREERFTPKAFFDENRPRVGYSTEEYEDGKPVNFGDIVDEEKGYDMMMNRVLRDSKRTEKLKESLPLLNDPDVEAVTLSRMYHQGPGNVVRVNQKQKNLPKLYKALISNKKRAFAEAVKTALPPPKTKKDNDFRPRLNREAAIITKGLRSPASTKKPK